MSRQPFPVLKQKHAEICKHQVFDRALLLRAVGFRHFLNSYHGAGKTKCTTRQCDKCWRLKGFFMSIKHMPHHDWETGLKWSLAVGYINREALYCMCVWGEERWRQSEVIEAWFYSLNSIFFLQKVWNCFYSIK